MIRTVVALVVIVAFAAFSVFLVTNADTKEATEWERWVYVFGATEAIAFAAVGWLFGREVNRERAVKAEASADKAQQEAVTELQKGTALAGMVAEGSGGGRERLERMGGGGGGQSKALKYAQEKYGV